jgi:hypothetical protein
LSSLHPAKRTGGDLRFRAGKHRWPGKFETAQEFDDAIAPSSFAAIMDETMACVRAGRSPPMVAKLQERRAVLTQQG